MLARVCSYSAAAVGTCGDYVLDKMLDLASASLDHALFACVKLQTFHWYTLYFRVTTSHNYLIVRRENELCMCES